MRQASILWVCAVAALAAGLGCSAPSRQLVKQRYVAERLVRYTWEPSGKRNDAAGPLYDLRLWVCNQQPDGTETRCRSTVVLFGVEPLANN
jgi:hypothetical protein